MNNTIQIIIYENIIQIHDDHQVQAKNKHQVKINRQIPIKKVQYHNRLITSISYMSATLII